MTKHKIPGLNFINRCMIHSIFITVPTRWRKCSNKTVDRLTTAGKRGRYVHRTNLQTSSRHLQTVYVLGTEYALGSFKTWVWHTWPLKMEFSNAVKFKRDD